MTRELRCTGLPPGVPLKAFHPKAAADMQAEIPEELCLLAIYIPRLHYMVVVTTH